MSTARSTRGEDLLLLRLHNQHHKFDFSFGPMKQSTLATSTAYFFWGEPVAFDGDPFALVGVGLAVAGVVFAGVGVVWGLDAAPFPLC